MSKPYRVTPFVRINNAVTSSLLRLGVPMSTFSLLTVRGRKSGKPVHTPIAIFLHEGDRYLIASYGVVNWVRNLRAAEGVATLTQRRHTEIIQAQELSPGEAAVILREALRTGPPGIPRAMVYVYRRYAVLPYLDVKPGDPLVDFEREAETHPVFLLQSDRNFHLRSP